MKQEIKNYLYKLKEIKDENEYSGRTSLENLLNNFTTEKQIKIIPEPSRDTYGKGSPDFKFEFQGTPIGYLETKKIGEDLVKILESEQIQKYRTLTDNLIVTDYLRWIWIYKDKIVKEVKLCEKTILEQKNISIHPKKCEKFIDLIKDFLSQQPQLITKTNELAKLLARPTRIIKEEIEKNTEDEITGLFEVFKKTISKKLTKSEFADAFAQTMTYSLFLTKLNLKDQNEKLQLNNIATYLPQSFSLMKDILKFINILEQYSNIKPYVERILHTINHIETQELLKNLRWTKNEIKDAYLYFYEDFLKEYDKNLRVESGVYYTPRPVVHSIIQNIDKILKKTFNLQEGLANKQVKLLDFATGTGTFLIEIYDFILSNLDPKSLKRKTIIQEHMLKNIYGFELLIPAYCISHLKCSQYLKEQENYILKEKERIPIYFTNTLEQKTIAEKHQEIIDLFKNLFPQIVGESKKAQEIKESQEILVITGNPPYNTNSKHSFPLIKSYIPKDKIKEKNSKILNDDYVKFIRFAEDKIVQSGQGIIGIITNNSFINGPIFRGMRKHLIENFEQIYIVDLHGNSRKNEKSPDGSVDENVFDIQQGVCISFFIKNQNLKEKGVYHLDLFGTREEKFEELKTIDIETTKFQKINPNKLFYLFIPQDETFRKEYEKGIGLRCIFNKKISGVKTHKDDKVIGFHNQDLERKIEKHFGDCDSEMIQNINYRPFDKRKIYYNKKIIERHRYNIIQHFINRENIGLVFVRSNQGTICYNNIFISNKIIDIGLSIGSAYIAPLYLYQDNLGNIEKIPNFQAKFLKLIQKKFQNPRPEEILAYIYGDFAQSKL